MRKWVGFTLVCVLFSACSGSKEKPPDGEIGQEYTRDDSRVVPDAGPEELAGEVQEPSCEPLEQGVLIPPDQTPEKFALSMFHFNLQYVAGGLSGWLDRPGLDLNEQEVEDRIIVESYEPLLDILLDHPTWGFDTEMQGYMLQITAQRHPVVLEKMRQLVETGQLHVDSFHYSDQLWVAHPVVSMEKSFQWNDKVFSELCMPLGRAVFTQEGQFGEGLTHHIAESGRVGLIAVNLWKYFQGDGDIELVYEWDGTPVVVVGKGASAQVGDKQVEVTWHFFDDGELAVTGNANPYFGEAFKYDKDFTAKYVKKLEQLEAEGWRIATVADYVDHLEAYGYEPSPLPQVLDGAWQPKDTVNIQRWMGLVGMWDEAEDDNGVLTTLTRSRFALQTAQTLAVALLGMAAVDDSDVAQSLAEGWRLQLLGEVSDSTGWNPFLGEVDYSREHAAQAIVFADEIIAAVPTGDLESPLLVDTGTGVVGGRTYPAAWYDYSPGGSFGLTVQCNEVENPEGGPVAEAVGWTVEETWCEVPGEFRYVEMTLTPGAEAEKRIQVSFARESDLLGYVPALMEDRLEVTWFDVSTAVALDGYDLALGLANGLLGLGNGNWLVSAHYQNHLAALLPEEEQLIVFLDETADRTVTQRWGFFLLENHSDGEAVEFANRVNVFPVVAVTL